MKNHILPLILILLVSGCTEKISPDLAFNNLKLDHSENFGDFKFIQKDNFVLSDCDNFLKVKNFADPANPGNCEGADSITVPLTKYFLYSSDHNEVIIYNAADMQSDAYLLDITNPLNITLKGRFIPGDRTLIAWDNGYLYAIENTILKAYHLDQLDPGTTTSINNLLTSQISLSGIYNTQNGYCVNDILYFEAGVNIYTINFTDHSNPIAESIVRTQGNNGFIGYKNYLLMLGNQEVTFLDLTDPLKPIPAKRISTSYNNIPFNRAVAIYDHYLYLGESSHLKIYDIEDINKVQLMKVIDTSPNKIEAFYFFGTSILCLGYDDTWYTPYINKMYFINNTP